MQITTLEVTNWLHHRHAMVPMAPMTMIVGPNRSGKSSLGDALAFALTGELRRVTDKGDRKKLVSDGAAKGTVKISVPSGVLERDVATGKILQGTALGSDVIWSALPIVLDPNMFARWSTTERRLLLREVLDAEPTKARIGLELEKRGILPETMKALRKATTDDIEVWVNMAKESASQARGAWKALTGEAYGSKKALDWRAQSPARPTEEEVATAQRNLTDLQAAEATAQQEIGEARAMRHIQEQRNKQIEALQASIAAMELQLGSHDVPAREEYTAHDRWRTAADELALLRAQQAGPLSCPHCGAFSVLGADRQLHGLPDELPVVDLLHIQQKAAEVDQLKLALDQATGRRRAHEESVNTINKGREELRELKAAVAAANEQAFDLNAAENADRARAATVEAQSVVDHLTRLEAAAAVAEEKTAKALAYHGRVEEWVRVDALLAPDGIPGELLAKAMGPMMDELRLVATGTGWPQVSIGANMEIHADGRPYALLSESERWRVDTSIGIVLARLSRLKILVLDRFDVLDLPSRAPAMSWLYKQVTTGALETCVLIATMKEKPQAPKAVSVVWLGDELTKQKAA